MSSRDSSNAESPSPSIEIQVDGQQRPDTGTSTQYYFAFTSPPRRPDLKQGFSLFYLHARGNFLQKNIEERTMYKIKPWLILFSHEPLTALLTLAPVQAIVVLVGVLWIILESVSLHHIQSSGYFYVIKVGKRVAEFVTQDYLRHSDLACSWELSIQLSSRYIIGVFGIIAGLLAMRNRLHRAKQALIVAGLLDAVLNLVIYIRMLAEGLKKTALGGARHQFLVYTIADLLLFPTPLLITELFVVEQVLLAQSMIFGSALGAGVVRYESICLFVATVLFLGYRELTRSRTLSEAMHSSTVLEEKWQTIKGSQSMFRLMNALRNVSGWGPHGPTFILPTSDSTLVPGEAEMNREMDHEQLRRGSLDQLYAQALLIDPIFLSKVKSFADASDGFFPAQAAADASEPHYVGWREAKADPTLESTIKWAELKNATRAIEKVLLLCDSDVSRLTDLVRQCIVFKDLDQLCVCLENIARDPEIEVVRTNNRLDPDYNSRMSGGYRDVALNLRIVNEETRRKGVEGHICELRLSLVLLHRQTSPATFERYQRVKQILRFRAGISKLPRKYADVSLWTRLRRWVFPPSPMKSAVSPGQVSTSLLLCKTTVDKPEDALAIFKGLYSGSILDDYLSASAHGVSEVATSSIMYSSTPLRSASYKPLFQVLVLMVAVVLAYFLWTNQVIKYLRTNGDMSALQFRLDVPSGNSSRVASQQSLHPHSFAVMRDSCQRFYPSAISVVNSSVYYTYTTMPQVNGWQLDLTASRAVLANDAREFSLYRLNQGSDLYQAADKHWNLVTSFSCSHRPDLSFCRSSNVIAHGLTVAFDMRNKWQVDLQATVFTSQSVFSFLGGIFAMMRNSIMSKFWIASAFHIVGVMEIVMAFPLNAIDRKFGQWSLFWGIGDLSYGMVLQFQEHRAMHLLPIYIAFTTFFNIAIGMNWFSEPFKADFIGMTSYVLLAIWLYFLFQRNYLYRKAVQQIEPDRRKYDECWRLWISQETCREQLLKIRSLCRPYLSSRKVEQRCLKNLTHVRDDIAIFAALIDHRNGCNLLSPVRCGGIELVRLLSLDQLYAQALLIDPIFLSKVKSFADASDGFFPAQAAADASEPHYVRWREAKADPTLESTIKWAELKNATRAIEKLVRSYNFCVYRLTDLVRQCIVFKDLDQLCVCLETIFNDPEIEVVRTNNRLDPDYNSRMSGGYRDVALNLRIVNEETRRKGAEGHICELQLILHEFHKLKSLEGHKRYVQFRNLRCE